MRIKVVVAVFVVVVLLFGGLPGGEHLVTAKSRKSKDVSALIGSLTQPEAGGPTVIPVTRWSEPVVRVKVKLPRRWPAKFRSIMPKALAWISRRSGVAFVETGDNTAPVEVRAWNEDAGRTTFYRRLDSTLDHVVVEIGCCRARVAWEELAQVPGVVGDHGGDNSVFSNTSTNTRPSKLDAWIVRTLYTITPGATAAELWTRFG